MKRLVVVFGLLLALSSAVVAQESKHEVTVQGSGFITKETNNNGLANNPTISGGFVVGYRYNLNRWFAFEGDFDYFRNAQKYQGGGSQSLIKTNVYSGTGALVVKFPVSTYVKPYALVGGGGIVFDPHDTSSVDSQARGLFVYGGGIDVPLIKHLALRGEYRGFVYKIPDFGQSGLNLNKFTHTAVPSAGVVYSF